MFKKFDEKESVSGITQLKSSVQKGIRRTILETYPTLEQDHLDEFMPKKDTYRVVKCHDRLELLINAEGTLLFFKHRDGPWIPTLRLLQQYPYMLVPQTVDKVTNHTNFDSKVSPRERFTLKCPLQSIYLSILNFVIHLSGCYKVCFVWCKHNVSRAYASKCKNDSS